MKNNSPPAIRVGISSLFMPTFVRGTRFEQLSTGNYPSFNYGNFRTRQVGLQGQKLKQITDNTFEGLHVGVAHVLRDGDTDTRVLGNRFSACEKGYAFLPVSSTAAPTQPTGTAYLSCNSFVRGVSAGTRGGVSYGIYNEAGANVMVANPVPNGDPILKNLFDDAGAGAAGFYAIYNANSNANAALNYYTYRNYSQQIMPLINGPQVQLTGVRAPDYMPGTACVSISLNGLQRTAAVTTDLPTATDAPQLEQNTPNPTQGAAHIAYHVPKGAQTAFLLVRRGLDGRLMTSLPVAVAASRCEVKLAGYPAGTYFYTLVVDGVPSATRRLVME